MSLQDVLIDTQAKKITILEAQVAELTAEREKRVNLTVEGIKRTTEHLVKCRAKAREQAARIQGLEDVTAKQAQEIKQWAVEAQGVAEAIKAHTRYMRQEPGEHWLNAIDGIADRLTSVAVAPLSTEPLDPTEPTQEDLKAALDLHFKTLLEWKTLGNWIMGENDQLIRSKASAPVIHHVMDSLLGQFKAAANRIKVLGEKLAKKEEAYDRLGASMEAMRSANARMTEELDQWRRLLTLMDDIPADHSLTQVVDDLVNAFHSEKKRRHSLESTLLKTNVRKNKELDDLREWEKLRQWFHAAPYQSFPAYDLTVPELVEKIKDYHAQMGKQVDGYRKASAERDADNTSQARALAAWAKLGKFVPNAEAMEIEGVVDLITGRLQDLEACLTECRQKEGQLIVWRRLSAFVPQAGALKLDYAVDTITKRLQEYNAGQTKLHHALNAERAESHQKERQLQEWRRLARFAFNDREKPYDATMSYAEMVDRLEQILGDHFGLIAKNREEVQALREQLATVTMNCEAANHAALVRGKDLNEWDKLKTWWLSKSFNKSRKWPAAIAVAATVEGIQKSYTAMTERLDNMRQMADDAEVARRGVLEENMELHRKLSEKVAPDWRTPEAHADNMTLWTVQFKAFQRMVSYRNTEVFRRKAESAACGERWTQARRVEYAAIGMANEAGEALGYIKKAIRGDHGPYMQDITPEVRTLILKEAADTITYGIQLIDALDADAGTVCIEKFDEVSKRINFPTAGELTSILEL